MGRKQNAAQDYTRSHTRSLCEAQLCVCVYTTTNNNNKLVLILTRHTLARAGLANRLLDRHEVVTIDGDVVTLRQATP